MTAEAVAAEHAEPMPDEMGDDWSYASFTIQGPVEVADPEQWMFPR